MAERGVVAAAKEVADHAKTLVGLELELAKLELTRKLGALGLGIGFLVGAAVVGVFALGFGLATIAAALATVLATWLALLITFAALLIVAGVLAMVGIRVMKRGTPPVPE